MSRYEHLPIFQKTYQLTLAIYRATGNFKREYKYTLGEKLKNISGGLLDLIAGVNRLDNKRELLDELDLKLETLRLHLRLAYDLGAISPGLLGVLNKDIGEIGAQIGGWRKWAAKKISPSASARVPAR